MLLRRLLTYCSFSLTAAALALAIAGNGHHLLAIFLAGPSSLLALIAIAILVASPPATVKARMREAQAAFLFSTGVMLLAASAPYPLC